MYRELDMTGSGVWRRVLVAVGVIGSVAVLAGCSHGPDPKAQRDGMVAATTAVIKTVTDLTAMPEPAVLDDATKPIACPSGEAQHRYIAYGVTDKFANDPEAHRRLGDLGVLVVGASTRGPGGADYYAGFVDVATAENGVGPRQKVFFVETGPGAGSTLTVDLVPGADGAIAVRFAGATACG
jgi:hypothetical protein